MERAAPVLAERVDAVAVLRLNRPERLNAVNLELYRALAAAVETYAAASDVRALVLTGVGRGFCAGADLKAHREHRMEAEELRTYGDAGQRANRLLQTVPKPVVAAVNGPAVGAGLELALSCDLIVVAEDAKLRLPEVALGTFIGGGASYTLSRRVGVPRAKELLFLGDFFDGRTAADIGLANVAVPTEAVLDEAMRLARRLTARAPVSMALAKSLVERAPGLDPEQVLDLEVEALRRCMQTDDWLEGLAAFAEGREPRFTGR